MSAIVDIIDSLEVDKPSKGLSSKEESMASDLRRKSDEEKIAAAFEWKMRGIPIPHISRMFGVNPSTIYRWLSRYAQDYREHLENQPKANIIAESLQFINRLEEVCMYEITQLDGGGDAEVDPDTGEVTRTRSNNEVNQKVKWVDTALKCERTRLRLMLDTGVLEKEPEKIYHTLRGKDEGADKRVEEDRTEEELMSDINDLLKKGRRI